LGWLPKKGRFYSGPLNSRNLLSLPRKPKENSQIYSTLEKSLRVFQDNKVRVSLKKREGLGKEFT